MSLVADSSESSQEDLGSPEDWTTISPKVKKLGKLRTQAVKPFIDRQHDFSHVRTVTVGTGTQKTKDGAQANRQQLRSGQYQTKQRTHNPQQQHFHKLENETENFQQKKLDRKWSQKLQQSRQAQGLTQKELAQKLNIDLATLVAYENSTAIPQAPVLTKLKQFISH